MIETKLKFAASFFDEEEQCGFYITRKRKEVRAIQLDLLHEFDQVCRKHNLRYYMDAGTLLGAVRHKGFIPWDDDVDVIMFRKDYNSLLKIAPDEFHHPYFFQHAYTDMFYRRGHSQLRNSKTCGALHDEMWTVKFNQGIFIDIFVLDAVSDDPQQRRQQESELQYYSRLMDQMLGSPVPRPITVKLSDHNSLRFENLMHLYSAYDTCAARFENTPTTFVTGALSLLGKTVENRLIRREWLGEPVPMQFECLTLPAPVDSDAMLRRYYGENYMTPIQSAPLHASVLFDTDRSYLDVISSLRL